MKVSAIITCAGNGSRAGFGKNKLLVEFNGKTVLQLTMEKFIKNDKINEIVITCSKEDLNEIKNKVPDNVKLVLGGKTRTDSVNNALKVCTGDIVLIHDGARPFLTDKIINDCIADTVKYKSSIVAVKSKNTAVKYNGAFSYLGKDDIYEIQTPQGFFLKDILKAYGSANKSYNDDGELYLDYISTPHLTMGDYNNVKLTYKEDFEALKSTPNKVGVGFDCHKLVKGRKLVLGGTEIPSEKGLLGHSDADVLTHAVMDAMLSACALKDIGCYFPDTDEKYKDISSMVLLDKVVKIIAEKGYRAVSVSAVIMAQKPKLSPYIPKIAENLASALNVSINDIGISATTLEGLGFVGREEGICVSATCCVNKIQL